MGKHIYFTPGPSQLYHTYDYHLKKAMNEEIVDDFFTKPFDVDKINSAVDRAIKLYR